MSNSTLTNYINESLKKAGKLSDLEEVKYSDGKVVKIADVEEKFRTACMYIFSNYSYFAPAVKALTPILTNEVDTMATDGIRIFMNPRFTDELTDEQCIFVIMHECMHNILNHLMRERQAGHTDHNRANIAADQEVNNILEDGIVKKGTTKKFHGYCDEKYAGWAYERIYADPNLSNGDKPQNQGNPQQGQNGQGGSGQGGQGGSGSQQQHGPDWVAGWNAAIAEYNSGKLKI